GSTTMAELRAAGGEGEPFDVRYWGVGNEPWGCGGNFTPEEYATEFRRYTAWVPKFGVPIRFIAAGPNGGDRDWTARFFRALTAKGAGALNGVYGWAMRRAARCDVDVPLQPDGNKIDRKSTRLNSSHVSISYAVFCLKKKK